MTITPEPTGSTVSQYPCNSLKQAQLYSFRFDGFATTKKQLSRSFGGLAWWQASSGPGTTSQSCLPLRCFPSKTACCYELTAACSRPKMWYSRQMSDLLPVAENVLAELRQDDVTNGLANACLTHGLVIQSRFSHTHTPALGLLRQGGVCSGCSSSMA